MLSRRGIAALGLTAAVGLGLAACGGSPSKPFDPAQVAQQNGGNSANSGNAAPSCPAASVVTKAMQTVTATYTDVTPLASAISSADPGWQVDTALPKNTEVCEYHYDFNEGAQAYTDGAGTLEIAFITDPSGTNFAQMSIGLGPQPSGSPPLGQAVGFSNSEILVWVGGPYTLDFNSDVLNAGAGSFNSDALQSLAQDVVTSLGG
jgi:hypothetical protein